jgi:hypothetical protein
MTDVAEESRMGRLFTWRVRHGLVLLFLPAGGIACLHHSGPPPANTTPARYAEDVPLEIANHNWLDVIIYVLHDGQRSRVGTANASSSASFTLPARMLGVGREIRLWGHPIGGKGGALTETVVVQPGQWIEWTLESDLKRSAIGVY